MAIVAGALIVGPGRLRTNVVSTDGTLDAAVVAGAQPVWGPSWVDMGLTDGGADLAIVKQYANHTVDQSPDWVASTITERHASLTTNIVSTTLANLQLASNGGVLTTGATWDKYEPNIDVIANPETYITLSVEGKNLFGKSIIVVIRRALNVDKISMPFKKDAKTMFSVVWGGHYVSDTTAPFVVYTQK